MRHSLLDPSIFGGTVRVIVLDNLKGGGLTPDVYDAALNPLYRDVLTHYGTVALPCRVGDPDRKGKVEAGVGHAKKTPLRGLRFESLDEAQADLDRWEAHRERVGFEPPSARPYVDQLFRKANANHEPSDEAEVLQTSSPSTASTLQASPNQMLTNP